MKHLFTNIYITTHILQRRNLGKILNLFLGDDTNIWVKLSNLGKLCLIKLLHGFNFDKPPQTPSIPSNDFGNNECDFQKYFPFVVALNWIFAQRSFYHVYSFFFSWKIPFRKFLRQRDDKWHWKDILILFCATNVVQ